MPLSCFTCLLSALLAVAVGGCTPATEPETETLFGFELAAFDGIPRTDVAVRIAPTVGDADLVQASSQLVADALRVCDTHARVVAALHLPLTLELTSTGSRLASPHTNDKPTPLIACMAGAVSGKSFQGLGKVDRRVTIQLRRHYEIP